MNEVRLKLVHGDGNFSCKGCYYNSGKICVNPTSLVCGEDNIYVEDLSKPNNPKQEKLYMAMMELYKYDLSIYDVSGKSYTSPDEFYNLSHELDKDSLVKEEIKKVEDAINHNQKEFTKKQGRLQDKLNELRLKVGG